MFNRSSVSHNIINLNDRPATNKATNETIFNRKLHNHKKSISDFFETGFQHEKPEYQEAVTEEPHRFKRFNGMCTFFLDASVRHRATVKHRNAEGVQKSRSEVEGSPARAAMVIKVKRASPNRRSLSPAK
jgi:hypothetical protein